MRLYKGMGVKDYNFNSLGASVSHLKIQEKSSKDSRKIFKIFKSDLRIFIEKFSVTISIISRLPVLPVLMAKFRMEKIIFVLTVGNIFYLKYLYRMFINLFKYS